MEKVTKEQMFKNKKGTQKTDKKNLYTQKGV